MNKKLLHRLILICSTTLLVAAIFAGVVTGRASYFVINVNQAEDLGLASGAKSCDTNLIDFDQTCSLRAAIEFAHQIKQEDPTIADFIMVNFNALQQQGIDTITINKNLPKIQIPMIFDGGDSECSNPDQKQVPKFTISGQGSYINGFHFHSFFGSSQTSSHGSKLCNLALDGFGNRALQVDGYWDYNNTKFKDENLASEFQFFNNFIGFDASGSNFLVDNYYAGDITVNSTQSVLFKNNIVRSSISLFNTNNIQILNNYIGSNIQAMPTSQNPKTAISISHGSLDDADSDNIVIKDNLSGSIFSSATLEDFVIDSNIICFSPYIGAGAQKFMNLCKSSAPVYLKGKSIHNFQFTNNQVDLGSGDSGFAFEPSPKHIENLLSISSPVHNLNFNNNKLGQNIGLPDSFYSKNVSIDSLYSSKITSSLFRSGNYAFNINKDLVDTQFSDLEFTGLSHQTNSNHAIYQSYSSAAIKNNQFKNISFSNYKKSQVTLSADFNNINFENLTADIPFNSNYSVSQLSFPSATRAVATPSAPSMYAYESSNGQTIISASLEYPTVADECDIQFYLANVVEGEYLIKNTKSLSDNSSAKSIINVEASDGICALHTELLVPANYIWHKQNALFAQVTTKTTGTANTSTFGDLRHFVVENNAQVIFDDQDQDPNDFSFPINQDLIFETHNTASLKAVSFDLDADFDSDQDGNPANDIDFRGQTLKLNLQDQLINGSKVSFSDDIKYPHKIIATVDSLVDTHTKEFELYPFKVLFSKDLPSCIGLDANGEAELVHPESILQTDHATSFVEFDFDALQDSSGSSIPNSMDGVVDNDIDSSDPLLHRLTYNSPGEKHLQVRMYDTQNHQQIITKTYPITVVKPSASSQMELSYTHQDTIAQFSIDNVQACIDKVEWNFGDGNLYKGHLNTSHTYDQPGVYQLTVSIFTTEQTFELSKSILIGVNSPSADFEYNKTDNQVDFTNLTSNQFDISYAWDFQSDGIVDSNLNNPSFIFDQEGDYSITLKASNSAGQSSITKEIYISLPSNPSHPTDPTDPTEETEITEPTEDTEDIDPAAPTEETEEAGSSAPTDRKSDE